MILLNLMTLIVRERGDGVYPVVRYMIETMYD